jgi:hypothetical protein
MACQRHWRSLKERHNFLETEASLQPGESDEETPFLFRLIIYGGAEMKRFWQFMMIAAALFMVAGLFTTLRAEDKKEGAAAEQQKPAVKEEAPPAVTGTATIGVFSKYIFRGYELSKNSVVFQPGLTASYQGFSASFWGNIDSKQHETQNFFPDKEGTRSFNETDLTLSYTKAFDKLSLTGGWVYYGTKYADETQEVFATVAYDMIGKPSLSIYRDIDRYAGTYFNLAFAHSIKVGGDVTLDLGASFGYEWGDGNYWETFNSAGDRTSTKYKGFHDGMVKAGLTVPITKNVSFVPVIQYWFPLSGKAKRHWDDTASYNPNGYLKSMFVGGANLNYNF